MARTQGARTALLTISQAADAAQVSRDVIRRRLDAGAFPNAVRNDDDEAHGRPWLIPPGDLEAAGLRLHAPTQGEPTAPPRAHDEVDELRRQLAAARAEAARWQAVAAERAVTIEVAQLAMRALPSGEAIRPRRWPRRSPR